jgi:hypothetical protein
VDQVKQDLSDLGARCAAYVRLNPGAVVDVEVDSYNQLDRWGIVFDNTGFVGGILDVVFADGGHTKNQACRRMVLTISGLDLERRIIILAIACVRIEDTENWIYIFRLFARTPVGHRLIQGLMIIVSDRDGGLLSAAQLVFPKTYVRFCIVHMIKNAKKAGIRGDYRLLVKIARTGSIDERNMLMMNLQESSPSLVKWLKDFYDWQWQVSPLVARGFSTQGCITNNVAESTMAMLQRPGSDFVQSLRQKTPGPMMLEAMRINSDQAQERRSHARWLMGRAKTGNKLLGFTTHAIRMFMQQQNESKFYRWSARGISSYAVSRLNSTADSRIVWIDVRGHWFCTCCFYEQFKILCRHILAVLGERDQGRYLLQHCGIGDEWKCTNYIRSFERYEAPAPSTEETFACLGQTVYPRNVQIPPPVAQRGRPRKERRKSAAENYRSMTLRRNGVSAGTPCVVCSICAKIGHNMRTCPILMNDAYDYNDQAVVNWHPAPGGDSIGHH